MTLRTVEDISRKFNNDLGFALQPSHDTQQAVRLAHSKVKTLLTQDRQATATALVTALEGMKYQQPHLHTPFHTEDKIYAMNATLDQAITIVKQLLTPTV